MARGDPGMTAAMAMHASRRRGERSKTGGPMGAIFNVFPLILIPVLIYNIWAFGSTIGSSAAEVRAHLTEPMMCIPMASQEPAATVAGGACMQSAAEGVAAGVEGAMRAVEWGVTFGDLLVLLSLCLLFVELLKSTSTGTAAIFNHALSMLVFIICLVEFLLHPAFATSAFFIIMIMSLLDVLAGVVVTIVSARRDVDFG